MCAFKITGPGKYIRRDGQVVELVKSQNPEDGDWPASKYPWANKRIVECRPCAGVFMDDGRFHELDLLHPGDIVAKVRAPKRKHRPKPTKKRKTLMTASPRYFIAEMKHLQSGKATLRILRQRKVGRIVPRVIVEAYSDIWRKVNAKYTRKSKLIDGRNAARRELNNLRAERLRTVK